MDWATYLLGTQLSVHLSALTQNKLWGESQPVLTETKEENTVIFLTSKQCIIAACSLLVFKFLQIEVTCRKTIVWDLSLQEKTIPVPAGGWLTGDFVVMYKNVPLIAVHSCGGTCWKIPGPQRASGPLSTSNVFPPPTLMLSLVYKCPSPLCLYPLLLLLPWHTHSDTHWNSIRCLITS